MFVNQYFNKGSLQMQTKINRLFCVKLKKYICTATIIKNFTCDKSKFNNY